MILQVKYGPWARCSPTPSLGLLGEEAWTLSNIDCLSPSFFLATRTRMCRKSSKIASSESRIGFGPGALVR